MYIYCCDFSARGVQHVKEHELYDEARVRAFQCDITTEHLVSELGQVLLFVYCLLSATLATLTLPHRIV